MYILTYFSSSIHFDSFSLKFRYLQLYRTTWVCCRYLELNLEFILDKVMCIRTSPVPFCPLFIWLDLEPVIITIFICFNIYNQRFQLLFQSIFPFLVFWTCMYCKKRYFICSLFYWWHHLSDYIKINYKA